MCQSRVEGFAGFWALRFPGAGKLEPETKREN